MLKDVEVSNTLMKRTKEYRGELQSPGVHQH